MPGESRRSRWVVVAVSFALASGCGGRARTGVSNVRDEGAGGAVSTDASMGTPDSGRASAGGSPIVGPADRRPSDWKQLGYDLGSTYFNTAETKLSVASV